jgi:hypothetical protein
MAATDQVPPYQTNTDGTTDTQRAPASWFASWLLDQVGMVEGPQGPVGQQGDRGPAGPQGMQGVAGRHGPAGSAGCPGSGK